MDPGNALHTDVAWKPPSSKELRQPPELKASKRPTSVDRYVGSRVRMQRRLMKMSQQTLGAALGLTYQQIQKYETGLNRIGASRLQQIANVLNVSPSLFLDGAPGGHTTVLPRGNVQQSVHEYGCAHAWATPEAQRLNLAFARIGKAQIRTFVVALVSAIADSCEQEARG
jgi:transcriptional regulator with XRE-family HTH domain